MTEIWYGSKLGEIPVRSGGRGSGIIADIGWVTQEKGRKTRSDMALAPIEWERRGLTETFEATIGCSMGAENEQVGTFDKWLTLSCLSFLVWLCEVARVHPHVGPPSFPLGTQHNKCIPQLYQPQRPIPSGSCRLILSRDDNTLLTFWWIWFVRESGPIFGRHLICRSRILSSIFIELRSYLLNL